jgi:hypothetical protein
MFEAAIRNGVAFGGRNALRETAAEVVSQNFDYIP